jgi:hypothetical protein
MTRRFPPPWSVEEANNKAHAASLLGYRTDGDPYIKGALRLANGLLDDLTAIRRDVGRL